MPRAVRGVWPPNRAARVLLGLVVVGFALRILVSISWWPSTPILDDGHQLFAASNPFADPQHPAGYALIIAATTPRRGGAGPCSRARPWPWPW